MDRMCGDLIAHLMSFCTIYDTIELTKANLGDHSPVFIKYVKCTPVFKNMSSQCNDEQTALVSFVHLIKKAPPHIRKSMRVSHIGLRKYWGVSQPMLLMSKIDYCTNASNRADASKMFPWNREYDLMFALELISGSGVKS